MLQEMIKQATAEFALPDAKAHLCNKNGKINKTISVKDLLPYPFDEAKMLS